MDQTAELEAHQRAYLQIFRAILKKKNATPDQAKAVLGKLQQYVAARIKAPDDFLDHIPNFAKGLAVRPEALSAFIGSNLLPALENVKKQMREAEAEASGAQQSGAGPAVSDAEVAHSVMKELEREVGTIVADQQRFSGEDMGYLRLVSLNGGQDVPSTSLREAMGLSAAPENAPPAAGSAAPGPAAASGAQPVTGKPAAGGGAPAAPAPVMLQETSVIAEILEQFGDELTVTGPLHVPAFPSGSGAAAPAAPGGSGGTAAASATASASASAGTSGGAGAATPGGAPAAAPMAAEQEPSLIAEILEQFGDELTVTGPLVLRPEAGGPAGGPGAGVAPAAGGAGLPGVSTNAGAGMESVAVAPVELPEVALSFQQYMDVVRKLQEFQTSGNQAGYREWLSGEAGDGGKAVVGLRNVDARVKRGDSVNWSQEYEKIAGHMHLGAGQIENLHERIVRFQKLQQLLNQFIASVKTKEPPLVAAVKKIWPQVRLLFNEEWEAEAMMSRLKIPLLQIMDPALKSQVQSLMLPLLKKAESLAKAS